MEKAELLNAFFALSFTSKRGLQESWSRHQGKICSKEVQNPAPGDGQAMHQYMLVATWLKSRTRGSGHKPKHKSLCLNIRKHFVTVRKYFVTLRVTQHRDRLPRKAVDSPSSGHSPGWSTLVVPTWGKGLNPMTWGGPSQHQLFCDSVYYMVPLLTLIGP